MSLLYNFPIMYLADFYKVSHRFQYPSTVTKVHSVLTARGLKYNPHLRSDKFMWFGYSLFIERLRDLEKWFYGCPLKEFEEELYKYKSFLDERLGGDNDVSHWLILRNSTASFPVTISALKEKAISDFQTPLLTVETTDPRFPWFTSFIETTLLSNIWVTTTAANRSWNIRQVIEKYFEGCTVEEKTAIDFMGHDFSYRGMPGDDAAVLAGCGHLANFKGSDTIPAAVAMEKVYGETTGFSVPATEHSVMCAGGKENEYETYDRLLDIYPSGIVSIVSDTWDYFNVLDNVLPSLKDKILSRNGKVVIRPDSGNPVHIVCGDPSAPVNSLERLGSLEILGLHFGTTLDSKGRKVLNSKIGLIYGDGMHIQVIDEILKTMNKNGWSPLNIVFGIGAFTYQYMTRDELSLAFKATAVEVDGKWINIQKNPKTDSGKKSLTGRFTSENLVKVF